MPHLTGFLDLLGARSFSSIWFWLVLVTAWTVSGRAVLGVPLDVLTRARRDPDGPAGLLLLDWLSLTLPRWRIGPRDGLWLLGAACFGLTVLAVLGFGYGREMAQALALLLVPFALLLLMRLRLAQLLIPLLDAAQHGATPPEAAVAEAMRQINRHRNWAFVLSVLAVAVTAAWGTMYRLMHPFGI
ncbi:MAG: hypothetical protein Q4G14_10100 [Paracoccus sp. (in: a-proteobacteria)]|uniref:hypothetical protein n=1 Tax=Paracoccus sp. TaxID=267 RepID=UPI0026E0F9BA|nr:hypothetical protein [Paracoccus sp. (in: a-proteobacteria)]MDO5613577.1 hypothetical protein [Paracoccus sp. (in: a-proteobacteria)]